MLRNDKFEFNQKGRDFVCGDIHGEIAQLFECMNSVQFDKEKDRIFSVGDLIDRGPHSLSCLELIYQDWFFAVKGNHEDMLVKSIIGRDKEYRNVWLSNGGEWSLSAPEDRLNKAAEMARRLPYSITIGDGEDSIGICHTDPPRDWNNVTARHNEDFMLWGRSVINNERKEKFIKNIGKVFCGHTPRINVVVVGNVLFVDTGAHKSKGHLTLLDIEKTKIRLDDDYI